MAKEQSAVIERLHTGIYKPRMFTVFMHNDDFTTMEFVVMILVNMFFKTENEAERLMLEIHTSGKAAVGTYIFDIAVSKARKATEMARAEGFPLCLTVVEQL